MSYGEYTPKVISTASTKCVRKLLQKRHDSPFRRNTHRCQLLRLDQRGQTSGRQNQPRVSQAIPRRKRAIGDHQSYVSQIPQRRHRVLRLHQPLPTSSLRRRFRLGVACLGRLAGASFQKPFRSYGREVQRRRRGCSRAFERIEHGEA